MGDSGNNSYSNFGSLLMVLSVLLIAGTIGVAGQQITVANLVIGGSSYEGAIDDVAIYNRSLTNQEVQQLYFSGNKSRI